MIENYFIELKKNTKTYSIQCTDSIEINDNGTWFTNDGCGIFSAEHAISGCTDIEAWNFVDDANWDDFSCGYNVDCLGECSESICSGDTNFDGIVDILDILRVVYFIVGNLSFNDDEFNAGDFNSDGVINVQDIMQMINVILD